MLDFFVPQRAFFTFAFACPLRSAPLKIDGNLRDWQEGTRLPELMGVDGLSSFASLHATWDDGGLYFGLEVKNKQRYKIDPRDPAQGDCLELFIDTRDIKEQRANRYCHRFYFLPGGSGRDGKKPIGRQSSIERAREQAPPCPEEDIEVGLRRLKTLYQMEIKIPARGLNGFQPREFDRLGFTYLLHDSQHGLQSWSAGRDLPVDQAPSTWGTIELQRSR